MTFEVGVVQTFEFNEVDGGGWVEDGKVGFKSS
jgi:hypothetical protein